MGNQKKTSNASRNSRGGGIAKRKSGARTDRDGDLVMDPSSTRGRGGGVSKPKAGSARDKTTKKSSRPSLNSADVQQRLLKHVGGSASAPSRRPNSTQGSAEEIRVTGWKSSKVGANNDGGTTSLIAWLERRASQKSKRATKIKKSRVEGDDLLITVAGEDAVHYLRLDGFVFAGANMKIERASAQELSATTGTSKESTVAMLKGVLARRYNAELKLLDLSALGADADLKAAQIFDSRTTTSKFFPALMKVLDQQFKSAAEKNEAITSVSLANNELPNVGPVTSLAQTLPQTRNLDLSNNAFKDLAALEAWRRRFPKLDHLVTTGNPLEQAEPDYAATLMAWYPKLRVLNTTQIRSDEDAEMGLQSTDTPFPVRSPNFQDEGQIAETFLRTFFAGFDADRAALAQHYYDGRSDFSVAVNTSAPRDPSKQSDSAPQDWELYIKRSRNLKKIHHPPARQSRLHRGPTAIHECWASLPVSRHPDLATQPAKWLIECQPQPGVPDPTGASPAGVDGFLVTVHGEFDEIDVSTGQATKTRSFDRTFVIGPGGPAGVRVVSDMLTVRAYGGFAAFEPDHVDVPIAPDAGVPVLPPGLAPEVAEQMVLELQKQTSMTLGYAKDCLDQVQWDFERALQAFAAVRPNLPADAFVVVAPPA